MSTTGGHGQIFYTYKNGQKVVSKFEKDFVLNRFIPETLFRPNGGQNRLGHSILSKISTCKLISLTIKTSFTLR